MGLRLLLLLSLSWTVAGDSPPRNLVASYRLGVGHRAAVAAAAVLFSGSPSRLDALTSGTADTLLIKMDRFGSEGVFTVNFTVDARQGPYRAIVDTGSPFLIVPSVCSSQWGCGRLSSETDLSIFKDAQGLPSLHTVESYGGQEYDTDWKQGDLKFQGATASLASSLSSQRTTFRNVIFGSVGEDVLRRPGGVFLGLVKTKARDVKPTLLGQLGYNAFRMDMALETLTLSRQPLLTTADDAVPLVDLLFLGSPVRHYAARVKRLIINGQTIAHGSKMYAIIDTGTSGCVLSDDITYNEFTPVPPREVRVTFESERGAQVELWAGASSRRARGEGAPFVVSSAFVPWSGFRRPFATKKNPYAGSEQRDLPGPSLVVLGMSFLRNRVFTVDADAGRMLVSDAGPAAVAAAA